jgi:hypothetical protein
MKLSTRRGIAAGLVVLTLGAAGCGGKAATSSPSSGGATGTAEVNPAGDIPDNQAYVPYTPPGGGYAVSVPEGWSRAASGGAVTFTDKLNSIRMESAAGAPLTVAAAKQTEVPKLASSVAGYRAGTVEPAARKAGTAVRITYLADAKPNAVTGKAGQDAVERYVFSHAGQRVTLTLTGPKGADNVDPWRIVTDSLRWSR